MRVSLRIMLLSAALAVLVASPASAHFAAHRPVVFVPQPAPAFGILSTPTGFPTVRFSNVPTLTPVPTPSATSPIVVTPAMLAGGRGIIGGLGFPVGAVAGGTTPQIIVVNAAPAPNRSLAEVRPTVEKGPKGVTIIRGPSIP